MILAAEYERLCQTPSDIYLHLPRFVDLVTKMGATSVVELGTRTGVSTIAWLHALEQTGGHLISVDLDDQPPIGDHDRWTFIQGNDEDPHVYNRIVDLLPPAGADIVFLDTSHWLDETRRELALYRWIVRAGGLIVCHDTELPVPEGAPDDDPPFPVKRAINEFCKANGFQWRNIPECFGLGVIQIT
jgi:cephalosporin hydroxylase